MTSQHQQPNVSPAEGYSVARRVMEDAVDTYLPNGGPAVARMHVDTLAGELLKIYPDCQPDYLAVLARISQAEKAELQSKAEQSQQLLQQQMLAALSAFKGTQEATKAFSDDNGDGLKAVGKGVKAGDDGVKAGGDEPEPQEVVLPGKLSKPKAMAMWERLQAKGWIDSSYQPVGLSHTDLALLAYTMNVKQSRDIERIMGNMEWKPFEQLWSINNLKAAYNRAQTQNKTPRIMKDLDDLFADIE